MQLSYQVAFYLQDPLSDEAEFCQAVYGHSYFQRLAQRELRASDERFAVARAFADSVGPRYLRQLRELRAPDCVYAFYTFGQVWRNLTPVREVSEHLGFDLNWHIADSFIYARVTPGGIVG